jgi:hypothetical protein
MELQETAEGGRVGLPTLGAAGIGVEEEEMALEREVVRVGKGEERSWLAVEEDEWDDEDEDEGDECGMAEFGRAKKDGTTGTLR